MKPNLPRPTRPSRSRSPKALIAALALSFALPLAAHAAVSVSIDIAPPPLPVYVQPVIPAPGYLWTPGYWRWSAVDGEYYWVPGTWIAPPYAGALWTPGYWGWGGGGYLWHGGYWGTHVGFYGGVNYGFGYVGSGYAGGYWNGGVFNYNRSVNNVNTTIVHNVYDTTVVENNHTRVSYNGGQGGVAARPSTEERAARAEPHTPPTPLQHQHERLAMRTPSQRVSFNHGTPAMAATPRPAAMHPGGGPGGERMHADGGGPRPMHEGGPQQHHEMHAEHAQPPHGGGGGRPERHEGGQAH